MKRLVILFSSALLCFSSTSCQNVNNLLNTPGNLVNGVLGSKIVPRIPKGFSHNTTTPVNGIDSEFVDPLDAPPLLSGEEEAVVQVQEAGTGA